MSSRKGLFFVSLFFLTLSACSRQTDTPTPPPKESQIDQGCQYLLPFASNEGSVWISQGNSNNVPQSSHAPGELGEYAYDFDLEKNDLVMPARSGTVVDVEYSNTVCGGYTYRNNSNFVVVDHGDGTYAYYGHLAPRQAVQVGDYVEPNSSDIIGYVGNTGMTNCDTSPGGGYHLHFHIQEGPEPYSQSIPICFSDVEGNGIPDYSDYIRSQNVPVLVQGMQVVAESPAIPITQPTSTIQVQNNNLVGLWEGIVESGGEAGNNRSTERFEITSECQNADLCALWPSAIAEMGEFNLIQEVPFMASVPTNMYCFHGSEVYYLCFTQLDHDTLGFHGTGAMWVGDGTLSRMGQAQTPSEASHPDTMDEAVQLLSTALNTGSSELLTPLIPDEVGYGTGMAGSRDKLTRIDFIRMLDERLVNPPACIAYSGNHTYTMVWTDNWTPGWVYRNHVSDILTISISFRDEVGYVISTAYFTPAPGILESVDSEACPNP